MPEMTAEARTEPATHRVTVPSADDMEPDIFALHLRLRHPGMWRTIGASRTHHGISHRYAPAGLFDHIHLPAEVPDPAPEPVAYTAPGRLR